MKTLYTVNWLAFIVCLVVVLNLSSVHPVSGSQAAVKSQIAPADVGFSYGIVQVSGYWLEKKAASDSLSKILSWQFDTESLSLQYLFIGKIFFSGIAGKGHLADWQNLEFYIDENTGKRNLEREMFAPYYDISLRLGAKLLLGDFKMNAQWLSGFSQANFAPRQKENSLLQIIQDGSWLKNSVVLGSSQQQFHVPYRFDGFQWQLSLTHSYATQIYQVNYDKLPIFQGSRQVWELRHWFQKAWQLGWLHVSALWQGGWLNLKASGSDKTDYVMQFSQGGSELYYNRLAGFGFSEFRVNGYELLNLDLHLKLFSGLSLWLVQDFAYLESRIRNQHWHNGSGIGLFWHSSMVDKKIPYSFYFRVDFPQSVKRASFSNALQYFVGSNWSF